MLDTPSALRAATGTGRGPQAAFRVPGLVAAALWAVGLMAGVVALVSGHAAVAVAALIVAVAAPWFGLAWVTRSRRRADGCARIAGSALRPGRPSAC